VTEVTSTAIILLGVGSLLMLSALGSRLTRRTGLPIPLVFLAVGVLAGSQGLGGIPFDDYRLSLRLGTAALVLILFDGGLNTSLEMVRRYYKPAVTLATAGVFLSAALVAGAGWLLGFSWAEALLLGAVVSSTDAASVFVALRASGVQPKRRVGMTLELESGLNDPVAVILTVGVTELLARRGALEWQMLLWVPVQLALGGLFGVALGFAGRFVLRQARLSVGGLYPVLTVSLALLAFALPTLFQGSGFLAVYMTAMILGGGELPYRAGLLRVHDAVAWFAQVGMFLLLGLLVFPFDLVPVALPSVGLALALGLFARPLAVVVCLAPFRYPWKEVLFIGLGGLRGAVPIILATFPVLAGVPGAERVFNVVFFVVLVNAVLPGAALGWVTKRLGLESAAPPPPPASLEITSTRPLQGEVLGFHIDAVSAVCNTAISEIPFPAAAAALLAVRGEELIAPKGNTVLRAGDHIYVFCRPEDRHFILLLFGRPERD
jgi:potassium/hydrogen antiporter